MTCAAQCSQRWCSQTRRTQATVGICRTHVITQVSMKRLSTSLSNCPLDTQINVKAQAALKAHCGLLMELVGGH